jgi:anti-sigma regulatory factor (Ser/Thr protein kinase)
VQATYRRQIRARRSEFPGLVALVEDASAASAKEDRLRLLLVVEELFCNSLEHGYGGECDQPVELELEPGADGCRVLYRDRAPEFNPFADHAEPLLVASPELRPVGGLGIMLLSRYATWRRYRRQDGVNLIELFVPSASAT